MSGDEPVGRVVKIFITGQDPRSLRTVELDNWTGVAITGQPEFFKKALEAEVLARSCVYLLTRASADDDLPEIYIGESDDFSQRYTSGKFPIEFDTFLIFTSKDDALTRAHVKWLELELWTILKGNSGKAIVANSNKPTGSNLPRADIATMRTYLNNMIYVLEALGYDLFSVEERTSATAPASEPQAAPDELFLDLYATTLPSRTDARAYLRYKDAAYTLLAGSKINPVATDSLPSNIRKLREALLKEGLLVQRDGYLELLRDIPFSKPSPASALVKGRSSTGYRDWLRKDDDRPLGNILSPAVQQPTSDIALQ
ncbi:DUF4357 domain-containing protein [Agrobacterium vitis]|uniref:DUF4357 domain-containing protein n=1 Tax=Agrobacterium vitis TaxID=373 RepID=A0ABD6GG66_AGRVI|nr:DUF4357 domain-containing protein [Agrobacterium vitis]MUO79703.1 DUF4357 domain-containing protein [Agrobacterium vitis]MUO96855.1 DUF4357 domain-containing protein [Agrobacterium vitis]MUP07684.1 DUF4357 domain-containing protein [Agrobacterium vitis]MUZ83632.1 DUF4357 domain-containing protein [Agrobacterium vitis]MVA11877.1 DUF4357 domain-containing protein [Agrobacterium vitis]